MKWIIFTCLASFLAITGVVGQADFATTPPYVGQRYASVPGARGLLLDDVGDILVVGTNTIVALYDTPNENGSVNVCSVQIVNGVSLGLNHGIAYNRGYLYASSASTVYRWPYTPGQRTVITVSPEVVVNNIPVGGHGTRTMIFDSQNRFYVQVGSQANVDQTSVRSRIRRFTLDGNTFPLNFPTAGEIFADGLRNEVGFDFDGFGILWGVENSGDNLNRPDLGGDIHNGNPAEELNRFDRPLGTHYGYPYCFTSYNLTGYNAGTQFAWPTFMDDGIHSDSWCRNISNNNPPALPMPAHWAPLGIKFYNGSGCSSSIGAFPCEQEGDAFIAFHGSWNSDVRVGYNVRRYVFNKISNYPTGETVDIIYEPNTAGCQRCLRPVNAIFDKDGHLIVSADNTAEIFRVYYNANPPVVYQGCPSTSNSNQQ